MHGFQWTMAIFAVASVIMFWITFATTKERVTPPPEQKTNVREELGELFRNWPWVMMLIASIFSTTFVALRAGSTVFFFKYVVGDDGKPIVPWIRPHHDLPHHWGAGPCARHGGALARSPAGRQEILRRRAECGHGALFWRSTSCRRTASASCWPSMRLAQFCAGTHLGADLGALWRCGRLRGMEIRTPIHGPDLFGFAVCDQDRNRRRRFPAAAVPGSIRLCERRRSKPPRPCSVSRSPFPSCPESFALLKAGALLIYPLNQKRVDEIERELAARRAASSSEG